MARTGTPSSEPPADAMRVVVRVRPLNQTEQAGELCISPDDCPDPSCTVVCRPTEPKKRPRTAGLSTPTKGSPRAGSPRTPGGIQPFEFHQVLWEPSSQAEAFAASTEPLIERFIDGFNGTCFAYGQTGSGKTYTMTGPAEVQPGDQPGRGVVQRTFEKTFELLERSKGLLGDAVEYSLSGQSFELYNEQLVDLLGNSRQLRMVEDPKRGVRVDGITNRRLHSLADAEALVAQAQQQRSCASTRMNAESSRSHTVLSLQLLAEQREGGVRSCRWSQLHLVDLAGSERQKVSETHGQRLKEGIAINSSLTSLGKVIDALVGRSKHVPYRESKLTFFLKDSLGGNCSTCLIATVSPSLRCSNETLSTLQFAQRAKKVQNRCVANVESVHAATMADLKAEVARLNRELSSALSLASAAKQLSASEIEMQLASSKPGSPSQLTACQGRVAQLEELLYNTAQVLKQSTGVPEQEASIVIKGLAQQVCRLLSENHAGNNEPSMLQMLKHSLADSGPITDQLSQASPNKDPESPANSCPNKAASSLLRKIGKPVVPFSPNSPCALRVNDENRGSPAKKFVKSKVPFSPSSPLQDSMIPSPAARKIQQKPVIAFSPVSPMQQEGGLRVCEDVCSSPQNAPKTPTSLLQRVPLSPCNPNKTPTNLPSPMKLGEIGGQLKVHSPAMSSPQSEKRKADPIQEPSPKRAKLIEQLSSVTAQLNTSENEVAKLKQINTANEREINALQTGLETMHEAITSKRARIKELERELNDSKLPKDPEGATPQKSKTASWPMDSPGALMMRKVADLQGTINSSAQQLDSKDAEIRVLKESVELSEEKALHMHKRIMLLEENRESQHTSELAHKAVVDQFQTQLAAKDLQIVAIHQKMQDAKNFSPQVKEVMTPIRQMMEKQQAEGRLSTAMEAAKQHVDGQLQASSKRIKSLCSEARERDAQMTDKCAQLLALQQRMNASDQLRIEAEQKLKRVTAQERASFDRIQQLQRHNELLKEKISGRHSSVHTVEGSPMVGEQSDALSVHGNLLFNQLQSRDPQLIADSYRIGERWDIEGMRSDIALYNMGFTTEAIKAQKTCDQAATV